MHAAGLQGIAICPLCLDACHCSLSKRLRGLAHAHGFQNLHFSIPICSNQEPAAGHVGSSTLVLAATLAKLETCAAAMSHWNPAPASARQQHLQEENISKYGQSIRNNDIDVPEELS